MFANLSNIINVQIIVNPFDPPYKIASDNENPLIQFYFNPSVKTKTSREKRIPTLWKKRLVLTLT
jgi:hypothetical protein